MSDAIKAGRRAAPRAHPHQVEIEIIADEAPAVVDAAADVLAEDGDAANLPRGAVRLQDGSIRLALRYPVTLQYRTSTEAPPKEDHFDELVFHRLLGADMRVIAAASPDSRAVVAIARSTRVREGLMHRLFDRMDAVDVTAAGWVASHFLGDGQRMSGR